MFKGDVDQVEGGSITEALILVKNELWSLYDISERYKVPSIVSKGHRKYFRKAIKI